MKRVTREVWPTRAWRTMRQGVDDRQREAVVSLAVAIQHAEPTLTWGQCIANAERIGAETATQ